MKWLSILALLVALPAQGAISLKDWEKKSNDDQLNYLGFCVVGLAAEVAKTDPALAFKIKNWYSEKPAGHNYSDGMNALLTRIVQLEDQAKEGKADLSKYQVEDIVYNVTAEKFKLPSREGPHDVGDFKDAAPRTVPPSPPVTAGKPSSRKATQETSDFEKAPAPPISLPAKPIMIGKIDVSHFAGLKPDDPPGRVVSLYGQAVTDNGDEKWYGHLMVRYYPDGVVQGVEVYSDQQNRVRSRAGNDALLDFFGRTKVDVIALLGQPKSTINSLSEDYLIWQFPIDGDQPKEVPGLTSRQTLVLGFGQGSRCFSVSVRW